MFTYFENKMLYNKLKIIDYILLLKLIVHKKGYYLYNNFYIEWISYLIPCIKTKYNYEYYDNDTFRNIICKYNINHNIFDISKNKNIYNDIKLKYNYRIVVNLYNKYNYQNKEVLHCNISLFYKYLFYTIKSLSFSFDIPKNELYIFKTNIWNYDKFNNYLEEKWMLSSTIDNDDYIYSDKNKKKLYFEIFNKIILRIIKYN